MACREEVRIVRLLMRFERCFLYLRAVKKKQLLVVLSSEKDVALTTREKKLCNGIYRRYAHMASALIGSAFFLIHA
jgi:hypothetical protein